MTGYATAADIAILYNASYGTIMRWASQDRWRRTGTYRKRYAIDDAQASYDRRHLQPADQHGKICTVE